MHSLLGLRHSFNGAMASQPWIRISGLHTGSPAAGFNGAMASQPWIPTSADQLPAGLSRFNGAMASQPWIRGTAYWVRFALTSLQWSHGLPAMDTLTVTSLTPAGDVSLQWSHGLPAMDTRLLASRLSAVTHSFNGAMASQPWIPGQPALQSCKVLGFNGAMASQPWIRSKVFVLGEMQEPLQWSHGLPAMDTTI